jgi:hypothetical protein
VITVEPAEAEPLTKELDRYSSRFGIAMRPHERYLGAVRTSSEMKPQASSGRGLVRS